MRKKIPQLRKGFVRSGLPPWMEEEEEEAIGLSWRYKPKESMSEAGGRARAKQRGTKH